MLLHQAIEVLSVFNPFQTTHFQRPSSLILGLQIFPMELVFLDQTSNHLWKNMRRILVPDALQVDFSPFASLKQILSSGAGQMAIAKYKGP